MPALKATIKGVDALAAPEGPERVGVSASSSSHAARGRRRRRIVAAAVGTFTLLAGAGCSTVSSNGSVNAYWLVRVSAGYGNIYGYPAGARPARSAPAEYLGPTLAAVKTNEQAAAKRLGITHIDSGTY